MRYAILLLAVLSLSACGKSGPPAAPTAGGKPVNHWLEATHDPDIKKRAEAVRKLGNLGLVDVQVLPALIDALNDPESQVRRTALESIARCGPAVKDAVPPLEKIRDADVDPALRDLAARVLQHIQTPN